MASIVIKNTVDVELQVTERDKYFFLVSEIEKQRRKMFL